MQCNLFCLRGVCTVEFIFNRFFVLSIAVLLTPPSALATSEGHSAERVKLKFTRNKYKKKVVEW